MSVTITDLMRRTSDTSRRIARLLETFEAHPKVRSAAAEFAGRASGLPQCEREGVTLAEFVGDIDRDEVRE